MEDWKPPKFGHPIWMSISATDIDRAHKFYLTVFGWTFKAHAEPASKIRGFEFTPDLNLSGGILLVPDRSGVLKTGHGGTTVTWHVEDLEKTSEAIVSAGGKMLSEPQPESGFGEYRYFEDTEGNVGGIYQIIKKE
ncbi:hypothetical protein VUR80DRAFT_7768 [Thermomyces stellatus]